MYTLRTFKDVGKINRHQINLGNSYTVKGVSEEDEKLGIVVRVHGESLDFNDGLAIFKDDYAFIMTDSGKTFECINSPKN